MSDTVSHSATLTDCGAESQLMGKNSRSALVNEISCKDLRWHTKYLAPGALNGGVRPMPLSGRTYDPDTLAMLYRALDEALHRAVPDLSVLDEASRQSIREKLARGLIQAYENGERDPELLTIIAVQSYLRDG